MMSMSMMSTFRRIVGEADPTLRAEPPPREPRHEVAKVLIMLMLIIDPPPLTTRDDGADTDRRGGA